MSPLTITALAVAFFLALHSAVDHSAVDHSAVDHSAVDHSAVDHSAVDHSAVDHSAVDHSAVERVRAPFHVRLKLSRGLASVVLVALGFYGLFGWLHLWRLGFLAPHEKSSPLYALMWVFIGHFLADFVWLVWGWVKERSKPRPDLILHHVMGLLVVAFSLWWEAGYAIIIICLTTEMMPMTTGLNAWGHVAQRPGVERLAWRLRLAVLWGWRMPLWIFEIVVIARNLMGEPDPRMTVVFWIGLITAVAFFLLDMYWSRKALQTLAP